MNPAVNAPIRGAGDRGWFGWYSNPRIEALTAAWLVAEGEAEQKRIAEAIQQESCSRCPSWLLGTVLHPHRPSRRDGDAEGFLAVSVEHQAGVRRLVAARVQRAARHHRQSAIAAMPGRSPAPRRRWSACPARRSPASVTVVVRPWSSSGRVSASAHRLATTGLIPSQDRVKPNSAHADQARPDQRQHHVAEDLPGRGAEVPRRFLQHRRVKRLKTANIISRPKGSGTQVRCAPRPEVNSPMAVA